MDTRRFLWILLPLLVGLLPAAPPPSGGMPPTIEGVIRSTEGRTVSGVELCSDLDRCIESGPHGKFRDDSDEWNLTGVLYLRKPGFVSTLVTPERPWTGLELTIREGPTRRVVIGRCPERPAPGHEFVGTVMQVSVAEGIEVQFSGAYSGMAFDVTIELPEATASMKLEWGGYNRAVPSRAWLDRYPGFELTEILFDEGNGGPPRLYALDVRASTADGRRSRVIGKSNEYIQYSRLPASAADAFDAILESLCVGGTQPPRSRD